jgi:hypothetical protein
MRYSPRSSLDDLGRFAKTVSQDRVVSDQSPLKRNTETLPRDLTSSIRSVRISAYTCDHLRQTRKEFVLDKRLGVKLERFAMRFHYTFHAQVRKHVEKAT